MAPLPPPGLYPQRCWGSVWTGETGADTSRSGPWHRVTEPPASSRSGCAENLCKPCPAGVFHRLCCVRGDTKPSALFLAPPGEGNTHSAADTGDSSVQKWEVTLAETWGRSSCSPTASVLSIKPEPTFCWVMLLCLCGKQRGKESGRDSGNTASVYFLSGRMLYFCLFIPSGNRVKNIYSPLSALPP